MIFATPVRCIRTCLILAFLIRFAILDVLAHSPLPRPLKRIAHPTELTLTILPRPGERLALSARTLQARALRHDDTFTLALSAFGESFALRLRPNAALLHPDAVVRRFRPGMDGRAELYDVAPLHAAGVRAYEGDVVRIGGASGRGWARLTVHEHDPRGGARGTLLEGAFSVDGVVHHVTTAENYARSKHGLDPDVTEQHAGLVIWRDSDVMDESEEALLWRRGVVGLGDEVLGMTMVARDSVGGMPDGSDSNFANTIGQTSGCPKDPRIIYTGVAADCMYTTRYGSSSDATRQILTNWNTASSIYKSTFNISLGIIELEVHDPVCPTTPDTNVPWNINCAGAIISERLSLFSQWRGNRSDAAGLWHLMSGCATGSSAGIAWVGTVCQQNAQRSGDGEYISGTAVSTAGRAEWQIVAHETGHNLGAIHDCTSGCTSATACCPLSTSSCDTNGRFIMSPVSSTGETSFSQCTIGNICSLMTLTGNSGTNTSCLRDASRPPDIPLISLQQCGNGIVEGDEECDPGPGAAGNGTASGCCDAATCRLRAGASCDPDSAPCCTAQCTVRPKGDVCRPAREGGCDTEEVCDGEAAVCPVDKTRADGSSCGSGGMRCSSGQCVTADRACAAGHCSVNPFDNIGSWYTENLNIAIPITVFGSLLVIVIAASILRRCCFARGKPAPRIMVPMQVYPPPPPQQRGSVLQRRSQAMSFPGSGFAPPPQPPPPAMRPVSGPGRPLSVYR